jgi:hypothetical protein
VGFGCVCIHSIYTCQLKVQENITKKCAPNTFAATFDASALQKGIVCFAKVAFPFYVSGMETTAQTQTERERRLELARQAFRDFYAQCFWSADPALVVEEQHIPFVVRGLRLHGGHKGYRLAAQLWPWEISNEK